MDGQVVKTQRLHQMPGDRLALTVRVGREVHLGRGFGRFAQLLHYGPLLIRDAIGGGKVLFHIHRQSRTQKVSNVSYGGNDPVGGVEVPAESAGLGRGLHNHQPSVPLGTALATGSLPATTSSPASSLSWVARRTRPRRESKQPTPADRTTPSHGGSAGPGPHRFGTLHGAMRAAAQTIGFGSRCHAASGGAGSPNPATRFTEHPLGRTRPEPQPGT